MNLGDGAACVLFVTLALLLVAGVGVGIGFAWKRSRSLKPLPGAAVRAATIALPFTPWVAGHAGPVPAFMLLVFKADRPYGVLILTISWAAWTVLIYGVERRASRLEEQSRGSRGERPET